MAIELQRVFDILEHLKQNFQKPDIIAGKYNKKWRTFSTSEFIENCYKTAAVLFSEGFEAGDRIIIICNNRPEWLFIDYGVQLAGMILVPVYPNISGEDLAFIINDCEAKAIFFNGKDVPVKLNKFSHSITHFPKLYSLNPDLSDYPSYHTILDKVDSSAYLETIKSICATIKSDDLVSILYTSGTTGTPKGVMLSHRNLLSNSEAGTKVVPINSAWRALSFLPLNHVYERMLNILYLRVGCSIYFAEGIETVADNLKEVKPDIFVTVPRLLERVFDKIQAKGEAIGGIKSKIFEMSIRHALSFRDDFKNSPWYNVKRLIFDRLVYAKWRDALGGNIKCVVSGGAALQPRLSRIFNCAGILVLEGYGLTETSPLIAVNNPSIKDGMRIGTVGPVISNTQLKFGDDDEILVKGPGVMLGYYKNPVATAEVIDQEGWFHTGDIGKLIDGKFLKITDRKKEIFKNSAGKYVAPLMIENKLKACRFIEQCMVIGEGQKFTSALIVPDFEFIREWCKRNSIPFTSNDEIIAVDVLRKEISKYINDMNKDLAPHEQVKRPEFLIHHWTIESGELTPKLSLKRKVILKNNTELIAKIFSAE